MGAEGISGAPRENWGRPQGLDRNWRLPSIMGLFCWHC